jgi:hypothetical protein
MHNQQALNKRKRQIGLLSRHVIGLSDYHTHKYFGTKPQRMIAVQLSALSRLLFLPPDVIERGDEAEHLDYPLPPQDYLVRISALGGVKHNAAWEAYKADLEGMQPTADAEIPEHLRCTQKYQRVTGPKKRTDAVTETKPAKKGKKTVSLVDVKMSAVRARRVQIGLTYGLVEQITGDRNFYMCYFASTHTKRRRIAALALYSVLLYVPIHVLRTNNLTAVLEQPLPPADYPARLIALGLFQSKKVWNKWDDFCTAINAVKLSKNNIPLLQYGNNNASDLRQRPRPSYSRQPSPLSMPEPIATPVAAPVAVPVPPSPPRATVSALTPPTEPAAAPTPRRVPRALPPIVITPVRKPVAAPVREPVAAPFSTGPTDMYLKLTQLYNNAPPLTNISDWMGKNMAATIALGYAIEKQQGDPECYFDFVEQIVGDMVFESFNTDTHTHGLFPVSVIGESRITRDETKQMLAIVEEHPSMTRINNHAASVAECYKIAGYANSIVERTGAGIRSGNPLYTNSGLETLAHHLELACNETYQAIWRHRCATLLHSIRKTASLWGPRNN